METDKAFDYIQRVRASIDIPDLSINEQISILRLTVCYLEKLKGACEEIFAIVEKTISKTK